jgi:hypothetical protein
MLVVACLLTVIAASWQLSVLVVAFTRTHVSFMPFMPEKFPFVNLERLRELRAQIVAAEAEQQRLRAHEAELDARIAALETRLVNTQDPALVREPLTPRYYLAYDYVLTGGNYNQHLGWVWVLWKLRVLADYRRESPYTDRREISPALAQAILA